VAEIKKHKKIEKELLPQYKEAIEKLKKNLMQLRMQLS
jgi:predicted HTH transcriptional regulator